MSTTHDQPDVVSTLQIVGGGKMGEALAAGLVQSGFCTAAELMIVEPDAQRQRQLSDRIPQALLVDEAVSGLGTVVAVKPAVVPEVLSSLAVAPAPAHLGGPSVSGLRVLSIAAGVRLSVMEAAVGHGVPVVRAMPNTPALVGRGASAIAGGTHAGADDMAWAQALLSSVGVVVETTEAQLDSVTGLSGSGPAYVFLLAEAMIDAGVLEGLPRDVSSLLAGQTLLGAAELLMAGDEGPAELRAAVTSPGGTTAAGLRALEDHGLRAAVIDAVAVASARSRQLGES